jgi:hypothetical protein
MNPLLSVLLINLLPAFSVVVFGWSAFTLVLLYWFENVIIGVLNAVKILVVGFTSGRGGTLFALALTPFFVFHYGLFCLVHGIFIFVLFGPGFAGGSPSDPDDPMGYVLARLHSDRVLFWNLVALLSFHLFNFVRYWIGDKRWRLADPITQMFAPYPRIVVVHLTILIAGIPVLLLGQPVLAVLCLALFKTGLETGRMHLFDAFAENPALAEKMRGRLKTLGNHARH